MTVVTCALPDESRLLLRRMERRKVMPGGVVLGAIGGREVAVFHTGMGGARVRERFPELCQFLEEHPGSLLLNIGYAGGLNPALPKGQLLLSGNHSSPDLLPVAQRILRGRVCMGALATTAEALETPAAKAAFSAGPGAGADAVDMETAAVAAFCEAMGLPMLSLRAISDTATEELAVPFSVCFDAARERPRLGALFAYLARHPSRVKGFLRFVREMGTVRAGLTEATLELVREL